MTTAHPDDRAAGRTVSSVTGAHRRTLDTIFRHPTAHNLDWNHVVGLVGEIGTITEKANNDFVFEVGGKRLFARKPHTKDLTSPDVLDLRHFLSEVGFSPEQASEASVAPEPSAPSLLIVVDHHGTKIFEVDVASGDAAKHVIRPYDPHHFLHHLTHKDQGRQHGQRAPEEPAYYQKIAEAVALGGRILVVGHGDGKSNAAHHLTEYLRTHHAETYARIVGEIVADLSAVTTPQLLDLARQNLRVSTPA